MSNFRRDASRGYYHTVSSMIGAGIGRTHVTLSQDGNSSQEEAQHSRERWQGMLEGLKPVAEGSAG